MDKELDLLKDWIEEKSKNIARDAAAEALKEARLEWREDDKRHADNCAGKKLADNSKRLGWIVMASLIAFVFNVGFLALEIILKIKGM